MGSIARTKYNNLCLTPRRLRVAALLLMLVGSVYVKEYIADIILMRRAGPEQQHTEQQAQAMKQGMLRREIAMPWAPSEGRMINAVITGGAGYIGSHMALLLLDDGHFNVTIIDNLSRSFEVTIRRLQKYARGVGKEGLLHWRHMELSDQRGVERVFREGATDLVLHFAGNAYVPESVAFPEMYRLNITVTTDRMVNAMLSAKVPYLVYSSSCATYGNVEKLPITENSPQLPISPYGEAKLNAEKLIKSAVNASQGRLRAVALRYFNVIGVDELKRTGPVLGTAAHKKYSRILDAIFDVVEGTRERIDIAGDGFPTRDGTAIRDYVHVSDLVSAHKAAFKSFRNSNFEAFNIGTGNGVTVKEIVDIVEKVTGHAVKRHISGSPRPGDAAILVSSADKLHALTGWKAEYTDVGEMVKTQWDWRQYLKQDEARMSKNMFS